jgi:hypothetical protein
VTEEFAPVVVVSPLRLVGFRVMVGEEEFPEAVKEISSNLIC